MTCAEIERALGRPATNPAQHIFVGPPYAEKLGIPAGAYTRYEWGWSFEALPDSMWNASVIEHIKYD